MIEAAPARALTWSPEWREAIPVRSAAQVQRLLEQVRDAVESLQGAAAQGGSRGRALHRHALLASRHASLQISRDIPEVLRLGPFQPGVAWPVSVRLSSAFPAHRSDAAPDQRGLAVRIRDGSNRLDLLATTGEAHHARDAEAMIASLRAAARAVRGGVAARLTALGILVRALGVRDAIRMARTVRKAANADGSLAAMTFYSRAPFQLGPCAVRYRFSGRCAKTPALRASGPDSLRDDLLLRLRDGPVEWSLEVQAFLDRTRTPMVDHRVPWAAPWVPIGSLVLGPDAAAAETGDVSAEAPFRADPEWSDPAGAVMIPLGDLNLLRATAYATSQRLRE